jgi:hypothetical protein
MADSSHAADSFPYPTGSVVGVLTNAAALDDARRRLTEVGFDPERCDVLHGEAGVARIDIDGDAHGRTGRLARRLQNVLSDDGSELREYAQHLREGHYVVGVNVGDDEEAKQRAANALAGAHAEFVHYYAESYVEDL